MRVVRAGPWLRWTHIYSFVCYIFHLIFTCSVASCTIRFLTRNVLHETINITHTGNPFSYFLNKLQLPWSTWNKEERNLGFRRVQLKPEFVWKHKKSDTQTAAVMQTCSVHCPVWLSDTSSTEFFPPWTPWGPCLPLFLFLSAVVAMWCFWSCLWGQWETYTVSTPMPHEDFTSQTFVWTVCF